MRKKYITVLDYETSRVFQYRVNIRIHSQDFIIMKGHRLANIEWMEHQTPKLITN